MGVEKKDDKAHETPGISPDESRLIARAKVDKEAFGELYLLYVDRIYNYIYYRTSNIDDAQDLTARTFQRALIHIGNYQDKGIPFSAWLYRIARNLVYNWHRDQGRRQMVALEDIIHWKADGQSPESLIQLIENEDALLNAIKVLPDDRQELLILKFLHRLPNAEIGAIMGRSEGAIKSLYHRTLLVLRDELTANDEEEAILDSGKNKSRWRFWQREQPEASSELDDSESDSVDA